MACVRRAAEPLPSTSQSSPIPINVHARQARLLLKDSPPLVQSLCALFLKEPQIRSFIFWRRASAILVISQPRIPVVTKLGPVVVWSAVGVADETDALDLLVPILRGHVQSQRSTMVLS